MNIITFQNTQFNLVQQNDEQIWITGSELARALGYAREDSVSRIYDRNSDEFTPSMTLTVKLTVKGFGNGSSEKEVRIFSLRGAHLIAMFARTAVAKEFRKWVLDILDKESQPKSLTDIRERIPLAEAAGLLVRKSSFNTVEVYKMITQRFSVNKVDEIPYDVLPFAVEYVHNLTAMSARSHELQRQDQEAVKKLVEAVINQNFQMLHVWEALRNLNSKEFIKYSNLIVRANQRALELSKRYNMRDANGQPLITPDYLSINFSNGQKIKSNANWFNAPA